MKLRTSVLLFSLLIVLETAGKLFVYFEAGFDGGPSIIRVGLGVVEQVALRRFGIL